LVAALAQVVQPLAQVVAQLPKAETPEAQAVRQPQERPEFHHPTRCRPHPAVLAVAEAEDLLPRRQGQQAVPTEDACNTLISSEAAEDQPEQTVLLAMTQPFIFSVVQVEAAGADA
jgi:hypothetical protein